ncbi:MAG: hypothetical protein QOG82_66 [Actinomycetota bacterium]|nr:hypothetical protein [Actinomycetota bacterium]
MRILYVTPLYLPWLGGLEVLCSQLLDELRGRGHEVAVVTAVNDAVTPRGLGEVDGVPVLRTDAYRMVTWQDPMGMLLIEREIATFIDDFKPDVAHGHDGGPLLWMYQRAARRRWPLLVTLHIVMTRHFADRLAGLAKLLAASDWVTGVSDDVVADTLSYVPAAGDRISVVRNGALPPGPTAGPVPDGPARLLCIGRLVPQKGFDRALDALAVVVRRRPEVHLTIVGVGPADRDLTEQVERLGLGPSVTFAGRVEHDEIGGLLAESTAVVMPSRFEGLPIVALEAAWMARPVVGTDVAGLRMAVADGVNGLLVAEDDREALAGAILRLVDDRDEARGLGAAARARVEREHSLAACVDQYEAIYARLVAEHAG